MNILLTGGTGYIGSHICVELLEAGHRVVLFDNLSNSSLLVLNRIEQISRQPVTFIRGDTRNRAALEAALSEHGCEAVIHLAGLKAVAESVEYPLPYYDNNVVGTISLLEAMQTVGLYNIVFSSSATVYGEPQHLPLTEVHPLSSSTPYGRTKIIIEDMLRDWFVANPQACISILRYFNPVGAHSSGLIGENPSGIPSNLMPYIAQVAQGKLERLSIWGTDYETPDGTGVRDYVHVVDVARGHLQAIEKLRSAQCMTINLGTGRGYSVFEVVRAFEAASGRSVPYAKLSRRPGDVATCYADPSLAQKLLGWKAECDIDAMCEDHWRWQNMNPNGYVQV